MINKVIKLKLQYFKHVYVQATCQRDQKVYVTCHDPKIYPHTKFGIPTSNYTQICSGLNHARTETGGQGHSEGAQWLSGIVLDSSLKGRWFEPHRRHYVVVLEQDTFILA